MIRHQPLALAAIVSIAAHVAAIGVFTFTSHASRLAEPKRSALTMRGARTPQAFATTAVVAPALPSTTPIKPVDPPPPALAPALARAILERREPADIAPPAEAALAASTPVASVPTVRLGFTSVFGGMRQASAADLAMQSAALAYQGQRAQMIHAEMQAHLAHSAATDCARADQPPCPIEP